LLLAPIQVLPAGDFRVGDLQFLPLADGDFDVVTGFNSFQFAADPVAALAEANRVAKPGTPIFVLVWGSRSAPSWRRSSPRCGRWCRLLRRARRGRSRSPNQAPWRRS
jgi:ubiquinone/menaquinone biosynthesis C-methylase UbiE